MKEQLKKIYYGLGITLYLWKFNSDKEGSLWDKIISTLRGYELPAYLVYKKRYGKNYKKCYSDRQRLITRRINDRYNILLDDKYINYLYFKEEIGMPKHFFTIKNSYLVENYKAVEPQDFQSLLDKHGKIILKPVMGSGGESIYLIEQKKDKIEINYQTSDLDEIIKIVENGFWFVSEYVEQASYSKKIFPWSANTLRLITLSCQENVDLVYALHRFGINQYNPTDNWSQGGISAKINMETGIIEDSVWTSEGEKMNTHPETGETIVGIKIPRWESLKDSLIKTHQNHFYIPMIAWDVVVTSEGFSIIEMNASSGVQIIQVHEPVYQIDHLNNYYR